MAKVFQISEMRERVVEARKALQSVEKLLRATQTYESELKAQGESPSTINTAITARLAEASDICNRVAEEIYENATPTFDPGLMNWTYGVEAIIGSPVKYTSADLYETYAGTTYGGIVPNGSAGDPYSVFQANDVIRVSNSGGVDTDADTVIDDDNDGVYDIYGVGVVDGNQITNSFFSETTGDAADNWTASGAGWWDGATGSWDVPTLTHKVTSNGGTDNTDTLTQTSANMEVSVKDGASYTARVTFSGSSGSTGTLTVGFVSSTGSGVVTSSAISPVASTAVDRTLVATEDAMSFVVTPSSTCDAVITSIVLFRDDVILLDQELVGDYTNDERLKITLLER